MNKQRRNSVFNAYLTNFWSKYGAVSVLFVVFALLLQLTGVFLFTRESANAATSSTLTFQARLLNSAGAVVPDGTYNLEFKLYDVSSGGTALWTDTRYDQNGGTAGLDYRITVKYGYFSINLADTSVGGTAFPGTINWDQELWLGMNVGGTAQTATPTWDGEMTPRFKLTAVPYAFKAGTALGVASNNTSTASTNSSNVSITSGNASGATSNSGNITIDAGTATQTAGTLLFGTANASALTIGRTGVTTTLQGSVSLTGTGTALSVTNDATIGGTLGVTGLITANGGLTITNGDTFTNAGATLNTAVAISNLAGGGAIGTAAATVDAATTFNINQTTASQTLTLPAPTNTTSGRIVYVNNVGSASFTMYGSVIATNQSNAFIWNGSTWVTTVSLSGTVVNAVGTIDSQTKSADGAVIASNAIYLQTADASFAGLVSTGTQTFAGNKTFNGTVSIGAAGTALSVTNNASIGGTLTIGASAGSGLFTNNGATLNATLAVANDADGGALGGGLAASASVDVYTAISINQTTASQTITLPNPTSATTGRVLYISNIGSASFTLLGTTVNTGTTATLFWNGSAWTFAGADGNGILNQNSADQTANFRISGTGRANTSFTTPLLDSISGGLSVGTSTATSITLGGTTNTTSIVVQGAAGATYTIGTSNNTGGITVGNSTASNTISIGAAAGASATQAINIGTSATASSTTNVTIGSTIAGNTTLQSGTTNINSGTIATSQTTVNLLNTTATTINAFGAATNITLGATSGTLTVRNANTTLGNAAGSGTFTNNGSTVNTTLALTNFATGGAIGTAAATVDVYTSISVNQTTASQTLSLPTPTASTTYGRTIFVSNIGTASFTMSGLTVSAGTTLEFVWSNSNGGASWQATNGGAGSFIQNQNGSDQSGNFRITGTGRANTSFTTPALDSITGALTIGATTATGITLGNASTTTSLVLQGTTAATYTIGTTSGTGAITIGQSTDTNTISIGSANGLNATQTVNIGNGTSAGSGGKVVNIANSIPGNSTTNTVNIANAGTSTGAVSVNIGSNGSGNHSLNLLAGGAGGQLNINTNGAPINIGTSAVAYTTTIGSTTSGSQVNIQAGTQVSLDTAAAGAVTIAGGQTTGTVTIGSTVQSGTITLGRASNASSTINIGSAAGNTYTQTINIGTSATGGSTTNVTIGSVVAGSTTLQSTTTNINSGTIVSNQNTVALLNTNTTTLNFAGAAGSITIGATSGTLTVRNANFTFGNAAGSGTFTNNGAQVNTTLALGNFATGGAIGTAAATVDIYTSVSVAQTTASQTLTVPTPTASTSYGRLLYLANIGSTSFVFSGVTINPGTTATLVWSNTNGGASWQFAGADGNGILNQNSADQTANFRISGTGRANTSFTTPLVDSITGALSIGTSTATSVTIGSATNNSALTLDSGTGAISIGTGAQARTVNIATGAAVQTLTLGSLTSTSTTAVQGGNSSTAVSIQAASGGTINIATTNANDIRVGGRMVLTGGLSPDITTVGGATTTGIIIQPGAATGASSNGGDVTIKGGNGSGATAVTGGSLIFQGGNATALTGTQNGGNLTFDAGTGNTANGSLLLGTNVDGTITIGKTTATSTLTVGQSTATNTINIGSANGTTATQTINIGGGTSTTSGGKVVNIANGIPGAGTTNTIAIGTAGTTTGTVGITIGSIGAAAHVTNIQAGTGTAAGDLNILTAAGGIINVGNNAVANKVLNLGSAGSTNAASTVNIATTNANQTQAVNIGATNSANNVVLIQGGTSNTAIRLAAGSAGTITVGSQTAANTVSIGTVGTAAFSSTVNIGTSTGAAQTVNVGSTGSTSSVTIDAGTGAISIGTSASARTTNIATGAAAQTVTLGSTNTTSSLTLAAGSGAISFNASQAQFTEVTGTRTLTVQTRTTNVAGTALTISGGTAGSGAAAFTGGTLTLQGGNAAGTGNANGANVVVSGGTGVGAGVKGLVVISNATYDTAAVQNFTATANITQANIDSYGAILISSNAAGYTATLSDPTITTAGRVIYVTNSGTFDMTLSVNGGGSGNTITLKPSTTATMIWNGSDWTAAGASSSTDLQAAYNNTATSAGGAELVLNAVGGAADGLTVRNNATSPIIGGIFEAQTSVGSNIFSVNNNATEYAVNGGAETSTNFSTNWLAAPAGGTVARNTTAAEVATGQASVSVVTTATASHGARNILSSTLTPSLRYNVSYTVKAATAGSSFTTLETMFSSDGSATAGNVRFCVAGTPTYFTGTASQSGTTITGSGTTWTSGMVGQIFVFANGQSALITGFSSATSLTTSASYSQTVSSQNYNMYNAGNTVKAGAWSRVSCTFTAPASGMTSNNSIFIRQTDATARTYYIDNLSVTVSADANHAVDGSVDDATNFATNWTQIGGATVARNTTVLYDTSASTSVVTTATVGHGVRNNMTITPSVSTQYLVTFYARSSNTFNDIRVRYSRDGGTNFVSCGDYNTQSISTTGFTRVTCLFTTDGTTASNPDLVIDQPTGTARTFYIDALSVTLNTNTSNNVQIGAGSRGGPVTLFTLDRAASSPIAANNDAYLGSMYYDTTTGRIQCYEADGWGACGSAPDNYVNLNPEYAGAVLNGSGVGTMTADFCANQSGVLQVNTSLCASGESRNFYRWTSPQASPQTYSIYVSYQLPATFKGFASDDTVQLTARTNNTTDGVVSYEMFKSESGALTACGTATTVTSVVDTWQTVGINGNESTSCNFTTASANAFVIFKINVTADSGANVYVGTLSFTTTGR